MRIIICGAGHVGSEAAEVLIDAKHNVTLIDRDPERINAVADRYDVATLVGNCAQASVLREAEVAKADLVLAATDSDEVNLVTASIARALGARKSVARVHEGEYYRQQRFSYERHLGIDRLICPEYATAESIAHILRNPAAIAIESFTNWRIEMQEFAVDARATAVGRKLESLSFPRGARLAAIRRGNEVFGPTGGTVVESGDTVVLIGDRESMDRAVRLFGKPKVQKRDVVVMGGPPMAVWFCRALRDQAFSIRLFEPDRTRAEQLAEELPWVTIINADATNQQVFREEHLERADVFVALTEDDEQNILGGAWAKSQGLKQAIAVVQRPIYLHLLAHIGIDLAFSPRVIAVREVANVLDDSPILTLTSLVRGRLDVYRIRVAKDAPVVGVPLKDQPALRDWMIAAVQHEGEAYVPDGQAVIRAGDVLLVVGPHARGPELQSLFLNGTAGSSSTSTPAGRA